MRSAEILSVAVYAKCKDYAVPHMGHSNCHTRNSLYLSVGVGLKYTVFFIPKLDSDVR